MTDPKTYRDVFEQIRIDLELRIKELMKDVERETDLTIKDYTGIDLKKSKNIINELSYEEVLDANNILLALGQMENNSFDSVEGWRLLSKAGISEKEIAAIRITIGTK